MSKKLFHLLTFSICASCIFMRPDSVQGSECSDLREKCFGKCNEIRLNDILQRECQASCQEAYAQCVKERPHCAAEDKCEDLQEEVRELRGKVRYLEGKLHEQQKNQD